MTPFPIFRARAAMLRGSLALALPLALAPALRAQVAPPATRIVRDTLHPFTTFRATVLSVDTTRMLVSAPTASGQRELHLAPALLRRLSVLRGRSYTTLLEERPTPAGLGGALVLREGRALRAVAEAIRDVPILRPADREGIEVRLLPGDRRTFVAATACGTIYNVPAEFTIAGQQVVLEAFETRVVSTKLGSLTISVGASQLVVPRPCGAVFEGNHQRIEYVITRNP